MLSFVDARVLEIVDDMMLSNFLAANPKATFARYIRVAKSMIKKESVPPLLVSLFMDAPVLTTPGITHINDAGFYISTAEVIFLMTQAADAFVKNDHKLAAFYASALYSQVKALLDEIRIHHMEQSELGFPTVALFFKLRFITRRTPPIVSCRCSLPKCVLSTTQEGINRRSGR